MNLMIDLWPMHSLCVIDPLANVAGDAALEMEALSDDEVQAGIVQLFHTFPSVPLPPGARMPPRVVRSQWGRDELFQGSYSYLRSGYEDGQAIDVIAQVGLSCFISCVSLTDLFNCDLLLFS